MIAVLQDVKCPAINSMTALRITKQNRLYIGLKFKFAYYFVSWLGVREIVEKQFQWVQLSIQDSALPAEFSISTEKLQHIDILARLHFKIEHADICRS